EIHIVRKRQHALIGQHDSVGKSALASELLERAEDALADPARAGTGAEGDDLPGEISAYPARWRAEKRHQAHVPGADLPIDRVERGRVHAHLDLSRLGRRLGHLVDAQDVGRTIGVESKRAHEADGNTSPCAMHDAGQRAARSRPRQPFRKRFTTSPAQASISAEPIGAPNPMARRCGSAMTMYRNCWAANVGLANASR